MKTEDKDVRSTDPDVVPNVFDLFRIYVDNEAAEGGSHLTKLGKAALLGHLVMNDVWREVFVELRNSEVLRKKWVGRKLEK